MMVMSSFLGHVYLCVRERHFWQQFTNKVGKSDSYTTRLLEIVTVYLGLVSIISGTIIIQA